MKIASIMIVETNTDLRNSLRHAFEDHGYRTWTCPAPEMAVSIFAAIHPDIVLLDVDIEGSNPLRLIDVWRELSPSTRVIVESKTGDLSLIRKAFDHGAHSYLAEPYSLTPLFEWLEKETAEVDPAPQPINHAAA